MSELGIYLNIGTLVTLIGATGSIVWKFSLIEKDNREWTEALIDNLRRDMTDLERGNIAKTEELRKETGEMGHSLRTKIHEIETWNRDTFVRNETFESVISRIEKSIEKFSEKLEEKLDKALDRYFSGHKPG